MANVKKKSINKILIANRGEIAVRIIRACREMNIAPIAVFSDADRDSLHVKISDQAYRIGPGPASESYLKMDEILSVAERSGADAIHPGYGLLSENAEFAEEIEKRGKIFIGPSAHAIRLMGSKTEARTQMMQAKVPVVPGSPGPVADLREGKRIAEKMGYPVLIKAVSGGGGRGMRVVEREADFANAFESAKREATGAFGDGRLYLERYLKNPRHVEIQVLGDAHGHTVHFGERECSVQRRHQKVIEESPCVILTPEKRNEMGSAAVQAAMAVNYVGAGTVEFLLDESGEFFFIEMNTRLQVEHPITEMVYGVDLVREQIRVARGESLGWEQSQIQPKGHAIECRLCAEDPDMNDQPCPGRISGIRAPGGPGIRMDSYVYPGYEIPMFYDPMFCKLITWGENREHAISRMESALREIQILGIKTNISLLQKILGHENFRSGDININFISNYIRKPPVSSPSPKKSPENSTSGLKDIAAIAAVLSQFQKRQGVTFAGGNSSSSSQGQSPWKNSQTSWKLSGRRYQMRPIS